VIIEDSGHTISFDQLDRFHEVLDPAVSSDTVACRRGRRVGSDGSCLLFP
jgi:hypothetical protein